jgi:hypothetical protein
MLISVHHKASIISNPLLLSGYIKLALRRKSVISVELLAKSTRACGAARRNYIVFSNLIDGVAETG